MPLLLRESDVERLIRMEPMLESLTAAMRELGQGIAQNQPRRRVFPPGGVLNVMFASWPGGGLTGVKTYTVGGGKVRFLVIAYDLEGAPLAFIEADHMGTFRTGAASGVAATALRPQARIATVIGTGHQALTQALALTRALRLDELRVFGRDPERRARFADQVERIAGFRPLAAPSAEAAVRGADVVVTITTSSQPVLESEWVGDSALVIGAGSNFPNRAELPPDLIARASTVVVDQIETAELEAGDLIQAQQAGRFEFSKAVALGEILAGSQKPAAGLTVFESQGLALWDLAAARVVLDAAAAEGAGAEVSLF